MSLVKPDTATYQQRSVWLLFGAVILLALVVRVISLTDHSLWYDEAFSLLYGRLSPDMMFAGAAGAVEHPPAYYLLLHIWMQLLGDTPLALRSFSVLFGTLSIVILGVAGWSMLGPRAGIAAAFIATWSPFLVQYSQEGRMYALLLALLLSATCVYWRAVHSERSLRWWLFFGVLAALAMYTQLLAVFYLAALALWPLVRRRWRDLRGVSLGTGVAVLLFLPWLIRVPEQLSRLNAQYWIHAPDLVTVFRTIRVFLTGGLELPAEMGLLALGLALLVVALLFVQLIFERRHLSRAGDEVGLVLWLASMPPILMGIFSQFIPVYLDRALIASAAMLTLLIAWLLVASRMPRVLCGVVVIALVLLAALGLSAQYTLSSFPYSPINAAMLDIRDSIGEAEVVVHMNKLSVLPAMVYAPDLNQQFIADVPGSPEDTLARQTQDALGIQASNCIQVAVQAADGVWFIVYERAEAQYRAADRNEYQDAQNWLMAHYSITEDFRFGDLLVFHYTDPDGQLSSDCD